MKKINFGSVAALVFSLGFLAVASSVYAQTATPLSVPLLYTQPPVPGSVPVNQNNTSPVPAGTYYDQAGQQIQYFGNGTYYDPSTQLYGGTVTDPMGTAGIFTVNPVTPGAPNTGLGGNAFTNWLVLVISGIACAGSLLYSFARRVTAA